jgi:hypothetical protein
MWGDFRSDVSAARINHSTRKETPDSPYQRETIHRRGNFKLEVLEDVNLDLHNLTPRQALTLLSDIPQMNSGTA